MRRGSPEYYEREALRKRMAYVPTGQPPGRPPMTGGNVAFHVYTTVAQERWLNQKGHDAGKNRSWMIRKLIAEAMAKEST